MEEIGYQRFAGKQGHAAHIYYNKQRILHGRAGIRILSSSAESTRR